jgi:hypothetical protein
MYDDLDVVINGRVELSPDLYVNLIVLTINGKEIEVDPLTAEKIYEALEVRINNKVEAYIDEMTSDNIVEAYERRLEMKREESRI